MDDKKPTFDDVFKESLEAIGYRYTNLGGIDHFFGSFLDRTVYYKHALIEKDDRSIVFAYPNQPPSIVPREDNEFAIRFARHLADKRFLQFLMDNDVTAFSTGAATRPNYRIAASMCGLPPEVHSLYFTLEPHETMNYDRSLVDMVMNSMRREATMLREIHRQPILEVDYGVLR